MAAARFCCTSSTAFAIAPITAGALPVSSLPGTTACGSAIGSTGSAFGKIAPASSGAAMARTGTSSSKRGGEPRQPLGYVKDEERRQMLGVARAPGFQRDLAADPGRLADGEDERRAACRHPRSPYPRIST